MKNIPSLVKQFHQQRSSLTVGTYMFKIHVYFQETENSHFQKKNSKMLRSFSGGQRSGEYIKINAHVEVGKTREERRRREREGERMGEREGGRPVC